MNKPDNILTLIAPKDQQLLTSDLLVSILQKNNLKGEINWLSTGEAADIILDKSSTHNLNDIYQTIKQTIAKMPIDFAVQSSTHRQKKLFIADMDSTIIGQECIDEIADMANKKNEVAAITERAMHGEIGFEGALRERVSLLKGLPVSALNTVINEHIHLNEGARTLVKTMAENGTFCALVSGGFTFFTSRIAEMAGFHVNQANNLEINDGQLTGNVIPPILGAAAKKQALLTFSKNQNLKIEETLAIGDGANDLEMIKSAGLGIAYYAKPIVAAEADVTINHTDLTTVLYFQGYSKDQFVLR